MKSSICWSTTLAAVLAVVSTTAFAQGGPGSMGPAAPYGGPVRGMPGYGGPQLMPAGMYGVSPGMPGGIPNAEEPPIGKIRGQGPPPGMMAPGMFGPGMGGPGMGGSPFGGPGMGGPGMGGPMGPVMQAGAQAPMPMDMGPPPELPPDATPWQNPFSAEDTACYDGSCGCCTQCLTHGFI